MCVQTEVKCYIRHERVQTEVKGKMLLRDRWQTGGEERAQRERWMF